MIISYYITLILAFRHLSVTAKVLNRVFRWYLTLILTCKQGPRCEAVSQHGFQALFICYACTPTLDWGTEEEESYVEAMVEPLFPSRQPVQQPYGLFGYRPERRPGVVGFVGMAVWPALTCTFTGVFWRFHMWNRFVWRPSRLVTSFATNVWCLEPSVLSEDD